MPNLKEKYESRVSRVLREPVTLPSMHKITTDTELHTLDRIIDETNSIEAWRIWDKVKKEMMQNPKRFIKLMKESGLPKIVEPTND